MAAANTLLQVPGSWEAEEEHWVPHHPPSPWSGPRMEGCEPEPEPPDGLHLPEAGASQSSSQSLVSERVLGVTAVAMISFFNVSGGPIGSEEIVGIGGPLLGLAGLLAMWLLFAVPQALVTAELSSAFPHNGGYSLWVEAAFGRFWGMQESYWSWCSGVVDNALYPVLLHSTIASVFESARGAKAHGDATMANEWGCITLAPCARSYAIRLLITAVFTLPNLVSVNLVGRGLQGLCWFVLLPFAALTAIAAWGAEPRRLLEVPDGGVDWLGLLSIAYWNVGGWDCASTFAGEVVEPGNTFPRGLALGNVLMLGAYLLPLAAAAASPRAGDWHDWEDGSFSGIASKVGGDWLGWWVIASSAAGNWGLFASELLEDSYQLLGMAEAGMAPRFFRRRHPRFRTPWNAILFQALIIAVLIGFDFSVILAVDNFFSAAQACLEFAAAVQLRRSAPMLERPFRVPLGTWGLAAMLAVPTFMSAATAVACVLASRVSAAASALAVAGGVVIGCTVRAPCCPAWSRRGRGRGRDWGRRKVPGEAAGPGLGLSVEESLAEALLPSDSLAPGPPASGRGPGKTGGDKGRVAESATEGHVQAGAQEPSGTDESVPGEGASGACPAVERAVATPTASQRKAPEALAAD